MEVNHGGWEHKLTVALWAYQTTYKVATHCISFSLTFGLETVMPMEYLVPSLRVVVQEKLTKESLTDRLVELEQLRRLNSTQPME